MTNLIGLHDYDPNGLRLLNTAHRRDAGRLAGRLATQHLYLSSPFSGKIELLYTIVIIRDPEKICTHNAH